MDSPQAPKVSGRNPYSIALYAIGVVSFLPTAIFLFFVLPQMNTVYQSFALDQVVILPPLIVILLNLGLSGSLIWYGVTLQCGVARGEAVVGQRHTRAIVLMIAGVVLIGPMVGF